MLALQTLLELMSSQTPQKFPDHYVFIKIYFDLAYYVGLSPFRLVLKDNQFTVEKWLPQTILAGFISLLSIVWLFRGIRLRIPTETSTTPTDFFNLIYSIFSAVTKLCLLWTVWTKSESFAKICNYTIQNEYICTKSPPITSLKHGGLGNFSMRIWLLALLIMISWTAAVIAQIFGEGIKIGAGDNSTFNGNSSLWSYFVEAGRYNFFLGSETDTVYSSLVNNIIGLLTISGFHGRRLLPLFTDQLVLVVTLCLWRTAKSFEEWVMIAMSDSDPISKAFNIKLSTNARGSKREFFDRYKSLKKLSRLVNETIGGNVTALILSWLLFYTTHKAELFRNNTSLLYTICVEMSFVLLIVQVCVLCYFSAEIPYKIKTIKAFIFDAYTNDMLDHHEMQIFMNETNENLVSLRASNVYPVTYSLFGNLLCVIVTYFVICLDG